MAEPFIVEFDRGGGVGGAKLLGELVLYVKPKSKTAKQKADFRFLDFSDVVYTFQLDDGHPVQRKLVGKLRIAEHERKDIIQRIEFFQKQETCFFCSGSLAKRAKGQEPAKQVKHGSERNFKFVWCCPTCRQPELVK